MAKSSVAKKVATLAWSIGLGAVLIMITTVVLLPSTKSARTRFDREDPSATGAPDAGGDSRPVMSGSKSMGPPSFFNGDEEKDPAAEGTPAAIPEPISEPADSEEEGPIMFGSKAPVVPLFNGERVSPPEMLGPPLEYDPHDSGLVEPAEEDPPGPPPSPVPQAQGYPYEQGQPPSQGGRP